MKRRTLLTGAAALGATVAARAQTPAVPSVVTIMVPFPPGGSSDVYARAIGPRMAKELGCTIIVENLAGASGSMALTTAPGTTPNAVASNGLSVWQNIGLSDTFSKVLNQPSVRKVLPLILMLAVLVVFL